MVLTALSKKDLLHKSQAPLPNRLQSSTVLSYKIKARHSVARCREQSVPSKETAKFQYWISFWKSEIYLQLHMQGFAKKKKKNFLGGHKYIFKIQHFLLAGFLNDDELVLRLQLCWKKVSIAKIRLHESLHQSFYVQEHIKGLQGV